MDLTNYNFIDLTHFIDENIPVWPGSARFQRQLKSDYPQGAKVFDYAMTESIGTHIDAPSHFIKNGRSISDLTLEELIAPACIIDVRPQVASNVDYAINEGDIKNWEQQHQKIPKNSSVVGFTGWSAHWPDETRYCNQDNQKISHFPGFSKAAAELLVERDVVGVGIDTFSIDCGVAKDYPAHYVILGAGKYQIENLMNLDKVPAVGATLLVMPLKIKDGPEAPARVIALVKKDQS